MPMGSLRLVMVSPVFCQQAQGFAQIRNVPVDMIRGCGRLRFGCFGQGLASCEEDMPSQQKVNGLYGDWGWEVGCVKCEGVGKKERRDYFLRITSFAELINKE